LLLKRGNNGEKRGMIGGKSNMMDIKNIFVINYTTS
jgi:hypothetical protein